MNTKRSEPLEPGLGSRGDESHEHQQPHHSTFDDLERTFHTYIYHGGQLELEDWFQAKTAFLHEPPPLRDVEHIVRARFAVEMCGAAMR